MKLSPPVLQDIPGSAPSLGLRQLGQKTAWSLNLDVNTFDFADKVRITMQYPHSFPLWRTNGELLPGGAPSRLVLSSVGTKWNDVVVEQHHFPSS